MAIPLGMFTPELVALAWFAPENAPDNLGVWDPDLVTASSAAAGPGSPGSPDIGTFTGLGIGLVIGLR